MPRRKNLENVPRANHSYTRTEHPKGFLHTCTACDRKVVNSSGLTPQPSRCPEGEPLEEAAAAAPPAKKVTKRARKPAAKKTTTRSTRKRG